MKHLDLLLISPPYSHGKDSFLTGFEYHLPPHGLMSVAAWVRSKGFSVEITDAQAECPSVEEFETYFDLHYPAPEFSIRMIGFSAVTLTIKKAYRLAAHCKKRHPEATILFGGAHPTVMPEEVLGSGLADIVVMGEGEITTGELLSGKSMAETDGIAYIDKSVDPEKIIFTKARSRIRNLDELPRTAYDLVPVHRYKPIEGIYRRLPVINMITSRGCPNHCTFCSKTLGHRVTSQSPERIFNDLNFLIKEYGIREVMFHDDAFTFQKKNVHALCDMIIGARTDILWTCFARADNVDEELIRKMKKAGCHQIMFGIENFDEDILRSLNKNMDVGQIEKAIGWTRKAGMECRVALMIGNPKDTEAIIKSNIRKVIQLRPDYLAVNIVTPYPGTELFRQVQLENRLLTTDWDEYYQSHCIMKLDHLGNDDITRLYKQAFRDFYLRPGYIFGRLAGIRSFRDVRILLKGFTGISRFIFKPSHHKRHQSC